MTMTRRGTLDGDDPGGIQTRDGNGFHHFFHTEPPDDLRMILLFHFTMFFLAVQQGMKKALVRASFFLMYVVYLGKRKEVFLWRSESMMTRKWSRRSVRA